MKKQLAVLFTLLIASNYAVAACPDLRGTYTCTKGLKSWTYEISQEQIGDHTEYSIVDDGIKKSIITDRATHSMDDTPEMINITYSAFCKFNIVMVKINGNQPMLNQKIGVDMRISKTKSGSLNMSMSGFYGSFPIPQTVTTCRQYDNIEY